MSLTTPPPQDDSNVVVQPPSLRFTILFVTAMTLIAIGYMWVWHAKTSRVVAEPPPDLVLGAVTSRVPGHDHADEIALRDSLAAQLRSVPQLVLSESVDDIPVVDPAPGRLPPRAYVLSGALDRAGDGQYSLELRRVDAQTDSLVYLYRVRGRTLPEVMHRMAVQVAMSFGLSLPTPRTPPAPPARQSVRTEPGTTP
jgi:hypothetical protein